MYLLDHFNSLLLIRPYPSLLWCSVDPIMHYCQSFTSRLNEDILYWWKHMHLRKLSFNITWVDNLMFVCIAVFRISICQHHLVLTETFNPFISVGSNKTCFLFYFATFFLTYYARKTCHKYKMCFSNMLVFSYFLSPGACVLTLIHTKIVVSLYVCLDRGPHHRMRSWSCFSLGFISEKVCWSTITG